MGGPRRCSGRPTDAAAADDQYELVGQDKENSAYGRASTLRTSLVERTVSAAQRARAATAVIKYSTVS